jgi:FtsH-binding integral membrane protein
MLNKIKSYYTGKCGRGDYFGAMLFCYLVSYGLYYAMQEYSLSPFIVLAVVPVIYFLMLGAIIQRANSFTNTPWFFGIAFILAESAAMVEQIADINGYYNYIIDDSVLYTRLIWFVMNLILLFRPAKAEN